MIWRITSQVRNKRLNSGSFDRTTLEMCFEMASDFMLWKELEAFSQALARASSLSYAAGIADFDGE